MTAWPGLAQGSASPEAPQHLLLRQVAPILAGIPQVDLQPAAAAHSGGSILLRCPAPVLPSAAILPPAAPTQAPHQLRPTSAAGSEGDNSVPAASCKDAAAWGNRENTFRWRTGCGGWGAGAVLAAVASNAPGTCWLKQAHSVTHHKESLETRLEGLLLPERACWWGGPLLVLLWLSGGLGCGMRFSRCLLCGKRRHIPVPAACRSVHGGPCCSS